MAKYANQNTIIINRLSIESKEITKLPEDERSFLGIRDTSWKDACKNLNDYGAFALYMYLADNKQGYNLDLSPAAISNAIGMAQSTYYKKRKVLIDKHYLVPDEKNYLNFFEIPQNPKVDKNIEFSVREKNSPLEKKNSPTEKKILQSNIVINNINTIKKDTTVSASDEASTLIPDGEITREELVRMNAVYIELNNDLIQFATGKVFKLKGAN